MKQHSDVIEKFGRYPHRNEIFGRVTTPEEQAWLEDPKIPHWARSQKIKKTTTTMTESLLPVVCGAVGGALVVALLVAWRYWGEGSTGGETKDTSFTSNGAEDDEWM